MSKPHLTSRQTEVVRLISLGCSVKEIAKILKLSPSTIQNHRHAAMTSMRTSKAAIVTRMAIKYGICKANAKLTPTEKRRIKRKKDGWN